MIPRPILDLPNRADELLSLLVSWAEINSGSEHAAGLLQMADALVARLRALTTDVALIPLAGGIAPAVRARLRPTAPTRILLSGHFDTVYGAAHPFQRCTRLDADTLRGPGVADMKGGIVTMIAALEAFEQTPHADRIGWEILLTPDEETGSQASRALIEASASHFDFGLIFEPARETGDLVKSRKGTGIFTTTCHGRAAHAGRDPAAGRNAIVALADFLIRVDRLLEALPGVMVNIGRIAGGGAVNIVPDHAQAEINVRIASRADGDAFLAALRTLADAVNARDGYRLEIAGGFNRLPMESGERAQAVFAAWQAAGRDLGLKPFSWVHVGGGSDGNLLSAAGLACLDGLGPVGDHLHSDREFIRVPTVVERAQIAALVLHRIAAGEPVDFGKKCSPGEGAAWNHTHTDSKGIA